MPPSLVTLRSTGGGCLPDRYGRSGSSVWHAEGLFDGATPVSRYRYHRAASFRSRIFEIHATLVWYERARDEARAQSLAKNKKGKKVIKSSATIEDSGSESDQSASSDDDEDRADNEVLDLNWVVRKLMALQMEVDTVKNSQSTNAESRAGSGTVPSGLHFGKGNAASSQAAPAATVSTGLKNKDDKAQAKEIRDKEVKAADAAERRAKGKVSIDLTGTTESTDSTAPKTFPADEKADKARRTKKLDPKNVASVATNGDTVVEPLTRKRRREQRAHVFDAEQDYQVPGAHPP
ncbi:hypothetical protein B0H12DRAFT_1079294 [Mycena haematopus]|nr:hypothetical protein B0H12DRAFT_1079294 [Mycena haematopus]